MKTFGTINGAVVALVTFAFCVMCATQSTASMRKQDFEYAFQKSEVVVDATVLKSELFEWTGQLIDRENPDGESTPIQVSCGSKVKLRINKTYSGSYEGEIEIGVEGALITGKRYLLFLDERSDFNFSPPFGEGPKEKDKCLSKLPPLKMNWNYSSNISGRGQDYLVLPMSLIEPDDLKEFAFTIESNWFVNGEKLDAGEFENIVKPTADEEERLERYMQLNRKASAICDYYNSISLCNRYTVLPFDKVDEWLDRQKSPKPDTQ